MVVIVVFRITTYQQTFIRDEWFDTTRQKTAPEKKSSNKHPKESEDSL